MDPLTHSLTGVMLGRAGLGKLYPRSTILLMLAANAPDIDIVAASGGSLDYLHYHRWITHSVLFLPILAALPALLICGLRRSFQGAARAWLIAAIAVGSHLILDWTNPYGIRLLSPVSERWFRGDLTSIVDVWIWAALLLAIGAPMLGRLVSSEMGARRGSGRGAAWTALAFLCLYDGGRFLLHERAVATLESRLYEGSPPAETAAFPSVANPLAWEGLVETQAYLRLYELNLAGQFDPDGGETFYKPDPSRALLAANATRTFRWFLDFCPYPIWSVAPDAKLDKTTRVVVRDARFGFSAGALVDAAGRVIEQSFSLRGVNRGN